MIKQQSDLILTLRIFLHKRKKYRNLFYSNVKVRVLRQFYVNFIKKILRVTFYLFFTN